MDVDVIGGLPDIRLLSIKLNPRLRPESSPPVFPDGEIFASFFVPSRGSGATFVSICCDEGIGAIGGGDAAAVLGKGALPLIDEICLIVEDGSVVSSICSMVKGTSFTASLPAISVTAAIRRAACKINDNVRLRLNPISSTSTSLPHTSVSSEFNRKSGKEVSLW